MGVHDCGRGCSVRGRWETPPGWVAPGIKSEGIVRTREKVLKSQRSQRGFRKEAALTTHPQPGIQRALPAAPPPPCWGSHALFLLIAGIYGHLHSTKCHGSATNDSICAPPPSQSPSPSLSLGAGVGRVQVLGPGKGFGGSSCRMQGSGSLKGAFRG